jgi:hypothetical protein
MFAVGKDKLVKFCLAIDENQCYLYGYKCKYENIQKSEIYNLLINMDLNCIPRNKKRIMLNDFAFVDYVPGKVLAYVTQDGELIIKDTKELSKLLLNPPDDIYLSVQDYAVKHKKSRETVNKYLKQKKLIGAKLIKSSNSNKGTWIIPGYLKWPAGNRQKGNKEKYEQKKRIWQGDKIEKGYVTSLQYSNIKVKSEQQVLNMCKSGRLEAKHIVKNEGNRNGYWIIKKDCPWPPDKRMKERTSNN